MIRDWNWLGDAIPKIIWCGRSTLLSIYLGCAAN